MSQCTRHTELARGLSLLLVVGLSVWSGTAIWRTARKTGGPIKNVELMLRKAPEIMEQKGYERHNGHNDRDTNAVIWAGRFHKVY